MARDLSNFRKKKLALAIALSLSFAVTAQEQTVEFDIPSQDLISALDSLAKQANIQLLYTEETIPNVKSAELEGTLSIEDALKRIFQGTDLEYEFTSPETVVVKKRQNSSRETAVGRSDVAIKLGDITVSAQGKESAYLNSVNLPSTVDVIGSDQIEIENVDFSVGLMKKIPGTYAGDWNQGVVSGTFSMRGYDTNNNPPVALIVDGVPHYWNTLGQADFQAYFPLEIEQIELVKGTNDPRYGIGNVAGTMNIVTKQRQDTTEVRLLAGQYNTRDAQIITGHTEDNISQTYFVGIRKTDGFRDHSDLLKGAMSGKWFYTSDDNRLTAGVIARAFTMDADAPGYLSPNAAAGNPTSSEAFSETDGGKKDDTHVSFHVDYKLEDNLDWSVRTFVQDQKQVRWARFSLAGAQQERLNEDDNWGIVSNLAYENSDIAGFEKVNFDFGVDYTSFSNLEQRYSTISRVRQTKTRDWDYSWNAFGAYAQADGKVNDKLRLIAGLRSDTVDGEFTNVLLDQKTDMLDFSNIMQPKIGTIFTPIEDYSIFANWGRTFQLPAPPESFGQTAGGGFLPRNFHESQNDGWEIGVTASPIKPVNVRLSYWSMTATNEVVADGSGGRMNGGETERKGVDLSFNAIVHPWATVWGSYSVVDAKFVTPAPGLENRKGQELEMVPEFTAKAGIDFYHPSGFSANLWMDFVDDYYPLVADFDLRTDEHGGYEVAHLSLGYEVGPGVSAGLDVRNIFDKDYYSWVWDYDVGYEPGQPRSVYGWVKFEY